MIDDRQGVYRIPAKLNAAIVALQIAAVSACVYAASVTGSWPGFFSLAAAFGVVMNSVYSTIHEAEHGILFPDRRLNDATGTLMALLFPAPFHLLRQGHLGHHVRNRSDDEAFDCVFDGEHPLWKRLQFYGIITGFFWVVIVLGNFVVVLAPSVLHRRNFAFDRPSSALMESLNPRYWKWVRLEALAAIALHSVVVWSLAIPPGNYALMYFGFGFTWSAMQYVHHFGTERHVVRGTRNLFVWGPLDLVWLNHNWHLAHHEHPTLPWIHLPVVGRSRRDGPAKRGFLPWAYLRMWRGPRRTEEHVENRYAGRVMQ